MAICVCGCGGTIPERPHHRHRKKPLHFIHGHNLRTAEARQASVRRHTGNTYRRKERVMRHGYWYVYTPNHPHADSGGRVAEHRLIMEAKLGRYLTPEEVVHHKNTNQLDNDPDNLELKASQGEHLLEHPGNVMHRVVVQKQFYNRHSKRWEAL